MTDKRVNIKVDAETRDMLRDLKRQGETWDGLLRRVALDAESPELHECVECGAVLQTWAQTDEGPMCLDCAGVDRDAVR